MRKKMIDTFFDRKEGGLFLHLNNRSMQPK